MLAEPGSVAVRRILADTNSPADEKWAVPGPHQTRRDVSHVLPDDSQRSRRAA